MLPPGRSCSPVYGLLLTLAACGPSASPSSPSLAQSPDAASRHTGEDLPLYGLGSSGERWGCDARGFRGFDFWLGAWNVYSPEGQLGGTNRVTRELDGCAVEEHWTDLAGGRGRSLNTFDAGTGKWHQLWMDASGLALILEGGSAPGRMILAGDTPQFIGGPIITNRISWTRLPGRRVRQFWEVSTDGRATWSTVFDGDYRRQQRLEPATEVPNGFCESPARPRFHWFDFIVGQWEMREGPEAGRKLGRLDVAKDLSGCLLEWHFRGARGYAGKAFAAFHFPSLHWQRDWIDEDGVRIGLTGELLGASMVFTGARTLRHGQVQTLRVTWEPVDADHVRERWETSTDGGISWTSALELVLIRRS